MVFFVSFGNAGCVQFVRYVRSTPRISVEGMYFTYTRVSWGIFFSCEQVPFLLPHDVLDVAS